MADISILFRTRGNNFHDFYFDSDMSKSTNSVVYFDWKTVIYIYVCGKCRTQFILPMKSRSHSPTHVRMRLYHRLIARLSTNRKKEVMWELNIRVKWCCFFVAYLYSSLADYDHSSFVRHDYRSFGEEHLGRYRELTCKTPVCDRIRVNTLTLSLEVNIKT